VDVAVRDALDSLLRDQSQGLVNLIRKVIGEDKYSTKQVKASLARQADEGQLKPPALPSKGKLGTKLSPYELDHHLADKPQAIVDLFQQLDLKLLGLGPDIVKRYLKYYVSYIRGKRSVVTVHPWQSRIDLFASIPFMEAPALPADRVRDVSKIGHLGLGDVEYRIYDPSDIEGAIALATASYLRAAKG
jgi:predicted transport protein